MHVLAGGSVCGYSTEARQKRSSKVQTGASWSRQAPYDFTGCCVHADVTYDTRTDTVERVIGFFSHNDECKRAKLVRYPSIPLHDHVYEVALQQLAQGARYALLTPLPKSIHCTHYVSSIATIQMENARWIQNQQYRDLNGGISATANHRYEILPSDFSRLYRRYYRTQGINVDIKPEVNVDNWLNPSSPSFHPSLAQAVFHYSARNKQTERFELCISTPEMRSAALDLVHRKQLVLDGTFGLSTSRLLLWIAMGIDSGNHGVPVAFFLFSAPSGTKATHAGYNTSILKKLLTSWKDSFSSDFSPSVAITDTDTKERGALINTWPSITLLLCRFHLRQCWTNKRNLLLRSGQNTNFFKAHVTSSIHDLDKLWVFDSSAILIISLLTVHFAVYWSARIVRMQHDASSPHARALKNSQPRPQARPLGKLGLNTSSI